MSILPLAIVAAALAGAPQPKAHVPPPVFTVYAAGQTPGFASGAAPYSIASGPDGNVWFTLPSAGNGAAGVGKIAPATGTVKQYVTGGQAASEPLAITAGGDGNMWFTDFKARAIGRITPAGKITIFTQGLSSDDTPAGITSGADGTLWFVSTNSGPYVGHVDLSGNIVEVAHFDPSLTADPSIGRDASGNVWFTGSNANAFEFLGEVTPAGVVSTHTLKLEKADLPCCVDASTQAFARGVDGELWFTNLFYAYPNGNNPLGRIAPNGVRFGRTAAGTVASIALGPDKRLWYAGQNPFFIGAHIGTIGMNGRLETGFALPNDASAISITTGPDGNLWMTGLDKTDSLIIKATP